MIRSSFEPIDLQADGHYVRVATVGERPTGKVKRVDVGGEHLAVDDPCRLGD